MSKKQHIPVKLRWMIWERDNYTCRYCGKRRCLSIDHVVPEKHGGNTTIDNLVTACQQCNSRKRTKNARAYLHEALRPVEIDTVFNGEFLKQLEFCTFADVEEQAQVLEAQERHARERKEDLVRYAVKRWNRIPSLNSHDEDRESA